MSEVAFDVDQITGASFPSDLDGAMFYPPEERYIIQFNSILFI